MRIRTELIDWYIKRGRVSRKEFCKGCNISPQTLLKIMRNDYKYPTASIIRIAEYTGIDVCDLYTND